MCRHASRFVHTITKLISRNEMYEILLEGLQNGIQKFGRAVTKRI
jgi:hypothetical protein